MPILRNYSLLTKTNIAIALILLVFFGITALLTYRQQRETILDEAAARARLIASQTVHTREYLSKHLRLGQVPLSDERYALIPIVASNRVGQLVAGDIGYHLRQVSNRYRNPDNAPDPFEKSVLAAFEANPYLRETFELKDDRGVPTFRYLQPFRADESCLVCHGKPEDAPEFIRARFPVETDPAYDYAIGEIIGAVSISLPLERLQNQIQRGLQTDLLYLGGVFAGLVVALGLLLRFNVTRPLGQLSRAIGEVVRTGHFERTLPPRGDDEIGRLIDDFNQMVEQVGEGTRLLEASEQRFRALTDNARDGIISFLHDGKVILFNHRAEALFGYSSTEMVGVDVCRLVAPECDDLHRLGMSTYLDRNREDLLQRSPIRLMAVRRDRSLVELEVSLSEAESEGHAFYTAIVRSVPEAGGTFSG